MRILKENSLLLRCVTVKTELRMSYTFTEKNYFHLIQRKLVDRYNMWKKYQSEKYNSNLLNSIFIHKMDSVKPIFIKKKISAFGLTQDQPVTIMC